MNILVCIKQVPDTTIIKIDPETNTLMREGVPPSSAPSMLMHSKLLPASRTSTRTPRLSSCPWAPSRLWPL